MITGTVERRHCASKLSMRSASTVTLCIIGVAFRAAVAAVPQAVALEGWCGQPDYLDASCRLSWVVLGQEGTRSEDNDKNDTTMINDLVRQFLPCFSLWPASFVQAAFRHACCLVC